MELMAEDLKYHADNLSAADSLGSSLFVECELKSGSETTTDDEGLTAYLIGMECAETDAIMEVSVDEDKLVDDIDYELVEQ